MAVIGVRQVQLINYVFVAGHKTIRNSLIHLGNCSGNLLFAKVRSISQKITCPFILDLFGPAGTKLPRQRQPHEQVYVPTNSRGYLPRHAEGGIGDGCVGDAALAQRWPVAGCAWADKETGKR